jgi:hypothetical protein
MRNFVKQISTALSPIALRTSEGTFKLEIIKNRKGILRELNVSKASGTVIGINSTALGEGMFMTSVEDVYGDEDQQIVSLKPCDMTGHILQRTQLALTEIRSVCPIKAIYKNPYLV